MYKKSLVNFRAQIISLNSRSSAIITALVPLYASKGTVFLPSKLLNFNWHGIDTRVDLNPIVNFLIIALS